MKKVPCYVFILWKKIGLFILIFVKRKAIHLLFSKSYTVLLSDVLGKGSPCYKVMNTYVCLNKDTYLFLALFSVYDKENFIMIQATTIKNTH